MHTRETWWKKPRMIRNSQKINFKSAPFPFWTDHPTLKSICFFHSFCKQSPPWPFNKTQTYTDGFFLLVWQIFCLFVLLCFVSLFFVSFFWWINSAIKWCLTLQDFQLGKRKKRERKRQYKSSCFLKKQFLLIPASRMNGD